jgi:hypothetical protein
MVPTSRIQQATAKAAKRHGVQWHVRQLRPIHVVAGSPRLLFSGGAPNDPSVARLFLRRRRHNAQQARSWEWGRCWLRRDEVTSGGYLSPSLIPSVSLASFSPSCRHTKGPISPTSRISPRRPAWFASTSAQAKAPALARRGGFRPQSVGTLGGWGSRTQTWTMRVAVHGSDPDIIISGADVDIVRRHKPDA